VPDFDRNPALDFHRFGVFRIVWRKLYAPLGLFDDVKLVALFQLQPREDVLR